MSQADLLARLEAVTVRLERAAARMGGGGGGGDDDDDVPPYVTEFKTIVSTHLPKVIAACNNLGLNQSGELLQSGYDNIVDFCSRVPKAKKPTPQEMMAFLKPAIDAIGVADNMKYKGKDFKNFGDHYKAVYEAATMMSWVTMSPPMGTPATHIQSQKDATDFNLLRIQKNKKDDKNKAFVKTFQDMHKAMADYGKQYFKKDGFVWNPKGGALGSVSGGAAATGGASKDDEKQASKPAGKKPASGGGGGMGAVFGSISKLTNAKDRSKLLKGKITDKDKTKNRQDRSGKVVMKKKGPKKAGRKKGEPKIYQRGGAWWAENHNEGVFDIDKANMKSNVYITMGDGATYTINNKVKAITIDSCNKCRVFVTEVVSIVEVVNCRSLQIVVRGKAPSITVDKSQDPHLILTKEAFACQPTIITSNVSNMNIQVPGATDKDDPIEIPVPYQFKTIIDPKTKQAVTEEVKHE